MLAGLSWHAHSVRSHCAHQLHERAVHTALARDLAELLRRHGASMHLARLLHGLRTRAQLGSTAHGGTLVAKTAKPTLEKEAMPRSNGRIAPRL